jgi:hypothetical protein
MMALKRPLFTKAERPMNQDHNELPDAFDFEAVDVPKDVAEKWAAEDKADFRDVGHDECVFALVPKALDLLLRDPEKLQKQLSKKEKQTTGATSRRFEAFARWLRNNEVPLRPITDDILKAMRTLERKHHREKRRCYPVTEWNLQRYFIRLGYRVEPEIWHRLDDVLKTLPRNQFLARRLFWFAVLPALEMQAMDRNLAWEYLINEVLKGNHQAPTLAQLGELKRRFQRVMANAAASMAEVHFGSYDGFESLPGEKLEAYTEKLHAAAREATLDSVDYHANLLKNKSLPKKIKRDQSPLIAGMAELTRKLMEQEARYSLTGYEFREDVVRNYGLDPMEALLADISDEARRDHKSIGEICKKVGIPPAMVHDFRQRMRYGGQKRS